MNALLNLPIHKLAQLILIQRTIGLEWRDHHGVTASEHESSFLFQTGCNL
jgi:hypothetical protein